MIWSSSWFKTWLNCDSLTPSLYPKKKKEKGDHVQYEVRIKKQTLIASENVSHKEQSLYHLKEYIK